MSKSEFPFIAVAVCTVLIAAAVFTWVWRAAGHRDAAPDRADVAPQLMRIKSKAMLKLRDGLAATEYLLLEEGIAQLREVNSTAGWYLSEERYGHAGVAFREALKRFDRDVARRDLASAQRSFDDLEGRCVACHRGLSNIQLDGSPVPEANAGSTPR